MCLFKTFHFTWTDLFFRKKERRSHSLNRKFFADYIGLDEKPGTINFELIYKNIVTFVIAYLGIRDFDYLNVLQSGQ